MLAIDQLCFREVIALSELFLQRVQKQLCNRPQARIWRYVVDLNLHTSQFLILCLLKRLLSTVNSRIFVVFIRRLVLKSQKHVNVILEQLCRFLIEMLHIIDLVAPVMPVERHVQFGSCRKACYCKLFIGVFALFSPALLHACSTQAEHCLAIHMHGQNWVIQPARRHNSAVNKAEPVFVVLT